MLPTSEILQFSARRTHRTYSAQFKAEMVAACARPEASISALALAQGMNPNVLHRWLREHERNGLHQLNGAVIATPPTAPSIGDFIPLPLPTPALASQSLASQLPAIEVELYKGDLHLNVRWPASLTAEFANWAATLLR
jgi:transposase-like protein